jgi:hypothetical protein
LPETLVEDAPETELLEEGPDSENRPHVEASKT